MCAFHHVYILYARKISIKIFNQSMIFINCLGRAVEMFIIYFKVHPKKKKILFCMNRARNRRTNTWQNKNSEYYWSQNLGDGYTGIHCKILSIFIYIWNFYNLMVVEKNLLRTPHSLPKDYKKPKQRWNP